MNYLEFLKIYEKHYIEMSNRKISSRSERRTYIEEQLKSLGYDFIIDETKENAEKDEKELLNKDVPTKAPEEKPKSSNFFINLVSKFVGTKSKDLAPQPKEQPIPNPENEEKTEGDSPKLESEQISKFKMKPYEDFISESDIELDDMEEEYNDPEFIKYCKKYWGDLPKNLDKEDLEDAYQQYVLEYGYDDDEYDDFYGMGKYSNPYYDTRYDDSLKSKGNDKNKKKDNYYRDEFGTLRKGDDKYNRYGSYGSSSRYGGGGSYGSSSSRYGSGSAYGSTSRYGSYNAYDYTSYYSPFVVNFYRNANLKDNIVVFANGFDIKKPTRILMAHYDVNTESSAHDNANDNGASIIILLEYLELKKFPSDKNIVVVFSDGEEFGGQGAGKLGLQINKGFHGNVEWVLNLDVVGIGDIVVFEDEKGKLRSKIDSIFKDGEVGFIRMPPNDAMYLRSKGVDSLCLSVLPEKYWNKETKKLVGRPEIWTFLHNEKDKWDTIQNNALTITLDAVNKIMNS